MCYLCEKYAPLDGLGKYDSDKDPSVTGARITVHALIEIVARNGGIKSGMCEVMGRSVGQSH